MKSEGNQSVKQLKLLFRYLNEKQNRLLAAAEADQLGRGAMSYQSVQIGISRVAMQIELKEPSEACEGREIIEHQKEKGEGRKTIAESQPGIKEALLAIVDPVTGEDPESPVRWSSKSTAKMADELKEQGFSISAPRVA